MTTVTKSNIGGFTPDELSQLFADNKATLVAVGIEAFKELFDLALVAIQTGGHFRKDVRSFMNLQAQLNTATAQELARLKALFPA